MSGRELPRFDPPDAGPAVAVRFPAIAREELANGLGVWSLRWDSVPVVSMALVIEHGASADPADRHGLAGLTADLLDEGAGGHDALQLAEAFARLGTRLQIEVGQESIVLALTTLARLFEPSLALLAEVLQRPRLSDEDFARVRDLRRHRLQQLRMSPAAAADRAFLTAMFGAHPYGHGTFGTTRALDEMTADDARAFYADVFVPARATLIVAGDVPGGRVLAAARAALGGWRGARIRTPVDIVLPAAPVPRVLLVDRPKAPQSELRIGHLGPPRLSPAYHALMTLNAALGGQFTSRINYDLRETKGYTYGARTGFDFRSVCSTFSCTTSVQSDATANAVGDVLAAYGAVRGAKPVRGDELARAKHALTRGYVRHFETPAQLLRATAELITFSLPADAFDQFVPGIERTTDAEVLDAAARFISADASVIAVVGDAEACREGLTGFGRAVIDVSPEF